MREANGCPHLIISLIFKMWFCVLVLTLACLDSTQSCTEEVLKNDPESSCNKCPAGFHREENTSKCRKCIGQTFTAIVNDLSTCHRCRKCDIGVSQEEKKGCEPKSDIVCGCKEGFYPTNLNKDLYCESCSKCKNCSLCSVCKSDINKDELKRCQPCQTKECTATSTHNLPNPTPNPAFIKNTDTYHLHYTMMYVLLVFLVTTLLMASLLVLTKGGWREHGCCANPEKKLQLPTRDTSANDQLHHQPNYPTSLTLNITEGIPMMTLAHSVAKTEFDPLITPLLPDREPRVPRQDTQEEHWPATVLYAIIKEVPLRRWKEFLRVLSLTDRQLERVELEPGLGSIERQYQMLRLWSQGPTASLEDIYSALLYMDLAGCAYQLQGCLEQLQWRATTNDITTVS
ncbi:tumor necrosis factor receptor superfamily member 1A-like isoform X2 [Oncorhynchus keta]|uniref:tumor necrosis factor receptor superfamily member 1A-like isoform X2 n=1 Tax=Oncorhynchus keta TaxID=8018 RepID=UPI00227C60FA|nr:tumor necrosis factor receptor superfamily member 1A-like isoform X2 [Oncorhynchus keta]